MAKLFLLLVALLNLSGAFGKEVCCSEEGYGCFRDEGIFSHLPLPECTGSMNLNIGMFTRNNRYTPDSLTDGLPSSFKGSRRTIFIVHGYRGNFNTDWMHEVKDLILEQEDANVVIVGWGKGADKIYYPQSASNTRTVAGAVSLVAEEMRQKDKNANLYCVGFSLGAHLCGHLGARVHLQRITGLDPAGPSFESYDIEAGLTPNRADLVDVIHTDGWGVFAHYGTLRPLGDIDFYPNGGYYQPGCFTRSQISALKSFKKANNVNVMDDKTKVLKIIEYSQQVEDGVIPEGEGLSCSHSRAPKYFLESIKQECFTSQQVCSDFNDLPGSCTQCSKGLCGVMGYFAEKYQQTGLLYHETTSRVPYCTAN